MRHLFAFLILIACAIPAWAKEDKSSCRYDLGVAGAGAPALLTAAEADVIAGPAELGVAGPRLARAIAHMHSIRTAPLKAKIAVLGTLMEAVRRAEFYTWDYQPIVGPAGETGFAGENGKFILLKPGGGLFKGNADPNSINDGGRWTGKAEDIEELLP